MPLKKFSQALGFAISAVLVLAFVAQAFAP